MVACADRGEVCVEVGVGVNVGGARVVWGILGRLVALFGVERARWYGVLPRYVAAPGYVAFGFGVSQSTGMVIGPSVSLKRTHVLMLYLGMLADAFSPLSLFLCNRTCFRFLFNTWERVRDVDDAIV